jgi:peptidoglycan/xylan/chitin deacetylase (PgdA/CDA1 family)
MRRSGKVLLASVWLLVAALAPAVPTAARQSNQVPVSADEVQHGDTSRPRIALVFNVGAGYTPATAILDTLSAYQQQSTFFIMGWWAARHPDELRQIADAGQEIGSHGDHVFDLTQVSDDDVRSDLQAADLAISSVTGRSTRPLWSPSAGYRDARVRGIAADLGYRPIMWTVDSGDWQTDATAESVYSHVVNGASNGAIIVLHFDSPTSTQTTAQILPAAIEALRGSGYTLVTVTQLVTGQ